MAETFKTITDVPGWLDRLTADGVPDDLATLYAKVPILFRAIQLRCDALSSIPYSITKGETEVGWQYPTALSRLLWQWEASQLLSGASYGEIIANKSGYRKDVQFRNPFDMTTEYKQGVLNFRQNSTSATWTNDLKAGKYEIVYMAEYDPVQDILPGIGAGKAARVDAKLLFALSKFPEMYFEGGAMPVTLLGIDSNDRGEIERIENWFKRSATSIRNAFRVMGVRVNSIQPTALTPPLKDLVMTELSEQSKKNIALAFGIRQTMLDSEAGNYATAKEDRLSFYEETIQPRLKIYQDALNTQLLAKDGMQIKFKLNELDIFQEDKSDRADVLNKLTNSGLPTRLALELAGFTLSEEQEALFDNTEQAEVEPSADDEQTAELRKWQRMAEKRVKEGKPIREFVSDKIAPSLHGAISGALEQVKTVDDVRRVFEWSVYP